MTAPERIWAAPPTDDPEWESGSGEWDVSENWAASCITEYVRADLAAIPAQVRVKPLVWMTAKISDKWERLVANATFGQYEILEYSNGSFGFNICFHDEDLETLQHAAKNIEAAKAAAQDDYEARILAAIEPQPLPEVHEEQNTEQSKRFWAWLPLAYRDGHVGEQAKFTKYNMEVAHYAGWCHAIEPHPDPRDEVIKGLVDALTVAANRLNRCAVDYETGSYEFIETCEWVDEARAALAAAKAVMK